MHRHRTRMGSDEFRAWVSASSRLRRSRVPDSLRPAPTKRAHVGSFPLSPIFSPLHTTAPSLLVARHVLSHRSPRTQGERPPVLLLGRAPVQGHRPRRWRRHWPALVPPPQAQPARHRAQPLRHPRGPRCRCRRQPHRHPQRGAYPARARVSHACPHHPICARSPATPPTSSTRLSRAPTSSSSPLAFPARFVRCPPSPTDTSLIAFRALQQPGVSCFSPVSVPPVPF